MRKYDYYGRFVELCSRFIDRSDDYADKDKLRRNNAARSQMRKLTQRILEEKEENIPELLHRLLKHENMSVQIEAAFICGKIGVYVDEFMPIMDHIQETTKGEIQSRAAVVYDMQRARDIIAMLKKGGIFEHLGGKRNFVPLSGQGQMIVEHGGGEVIRIDEAHAEDADPSDNHPFRHVHYVMDGVSGVFQIQSPFGIQVMKIMERKRKEEKEQSYSQEE